MQVVDAHTATHGHFVRAQVTCTASQSVRQGQHRRSARADTVRARVRAPACVAVFFFFFEMVLEKARQVWSTPRVSMYPDVIIFSFLNFFLLGRFSKPASLHIKQAPWIRNLEKILPKTT